MKLVVYANDETAAVNGARAAFDRIAQINDVASDYQKDSELMRLCSAAATRPVAVSEDLWTLLSESQRLSKLSEGAFDITVGPYVRLWRIARAGGRLPTAEEIADAAKRVGYEKITLDPASRSVRLAVPGMKLDMGGIAKGYAGDQAIKTLREHGITSAMCEAGGDIVVSDPPPGAPGWNIALEDASPDMPRVLTVHNCGISTSGDTVQWVEIGGKHYSHVVDPHTGIGLTSRNMGTVIAPCGTWSDGLSKAVTILPKEKIPELLKDYPGAKYYLRVVRD